MPKKTFHNTIALYLRLSKDDGDKEESESISNQRNIINDYISKNFEYKNKIEFIDDGYSGSNFNRPAFISMFKEVKKGNINLVITKNLARFGRSYIETGDYIEKIFPNYNTRYIAILDNVDNYEDKISNDFAPIKGVFNEMYCRETSKNVKKSKREKMKDGFYACNIAPFGYKKSEETKGKLEIDEKAAKIVKLIFSMKASGKTIKEIAEILTERKIPTPAYYLEIKGLEQIESKNIWRTSSIKSILANQVYLGYCIRGKTQSISYKSKKRLHIRRDECIIVKNTHEPIISEELFNRVHTTKKYGASKIEKEFDILLDNLMYCNKCGKKLFKKRSYKRIKIYCGKNEENNALCSNSMLLFYDEVEKKVINELTKYYDEHINNNQMRDKLLKRYNNLKIKKLQEELAEKEKDKRKVQFKISELYNSRLSQSIDEKTYKENYSLLINERNSLELLIKDINEEIELYHQENSSKDNEKVIEKVLSNIKKGKYTKEDIMKIINKILLDKENLKISFNFIKE